MKTIGLLRVFVILAWSSIDIFAQEAPDRVDALKTVTPPSPEAASLGKYAAWPVNLYTGTTGVDIPLHTMSSQSITIPVSISYHASGNRVGDLASSVGLGWTLNAGGAVMRSVKGLPDDQDNGFFKFREKYSNKNDLTSPVNPGESFNQNLSWMADGHQDPEHDTYTISVLGKSYTVLFKGSGTSDFVTIPQSHLDIHFDFVAETWKVTLEDGTVLDFGGTSYTEYTASDNPDIDIYASSWLLKKVTGPVGDVIDFTYTSATGAAHTAMAARKDKIQIGGCVCAGGGAQMGHGSDPEPTSAVLLLQSITSASEKLETVTPTGRQDIQGGRVYSQLKVTSLVSDKIVKRYTFNTSYSTAVSGNNYRAPTSYMLKRLRLDRLDLVKPYSSPDQIISSWSFQYNPQNLPARTSNAQDHWGYFNGRTDNVTFLPLLPPIGPGEGFTPETYPVADREANATFAQAEILNKIVYPTGGYTTFDYELNGYENNEEQYVSHTDSSFIDASDVNYQPSSIPKTIFIKKNQYVKLRLSATFSTAYWNEHLNTQWQAMVEVKNSSNVVVASYALNNNGLASKYFAFKNIGPNNTTFTFTVKARETDPIPGQFHIEGFVTYQRGDGVQTVDKKMAGLRILRIKDYESATAAPIIRKYQYAGFNILQPFNPLNEYVTNLSSVAGSCGQCMQDFAIRNAYTKSALANPTVGYGTVTELHGENGENGKTVSTFTNDPDEDLLMSSVFPFPPLFSKAWKRGVLTKQEDYKHGTPDVLVKQVESFYNVTESTVLNAMKAGRATIYINYTEEFMSDGVVWSSYREGTGIRQLQSVTVTEIESPAIQHVTHTEYLYQGTNLNSIGTRTTDSKGNVITRHNWTVKEKDDIEAEFEIDLDVVPSPIGALNTRNMLTTVIATKEEVGSTTTTRMLTNFHPTSLFPNVFPKEIYVGNGANPIERRINFNSYDVHGNLLEQSKESDIHYSYLWDYNASYLTCEITNCSSTSTDYAYSSFEDSNDGGWEAPSQILGTDGGRTGSRYLKLPTNGLIKTGLDANKQYLVSFWTKSSSPPLVITLVGTQTPNLIRSVEGWKYYELVIENTSSATITGTNKEIDEARLHPIDVRMVTYTYDPSVGITSKTDATGVSIFYGYDEANRLRYIWDDSMNLIKTISYHFKGQQ
jgi:hypothetical protein